MEIEREELDDELTVIRVSGDIDYPDVNRLLDELRASISDGPRHILINLSGCTSIVSSAIGVLVGWTPESALAERKFGVVCPSPPVLDLLERIGIEETLVRPQESEEEAVAAFRKELVD